MTRPDESIPMTRDWGWVMTSTWLDTGDVTHAIGVEPTVDGSTVTFIGLSRTWVVKATAPVKKASDGSIQFPSDQIQNEIRPLQETDASWLTRSGVPSLPMDRVLRLASGELDGPDSLLLAIKPGATPTLLYTDPEVTLYRRNGQWLPMPAADPLGLFDDREVRYVPPEAVGLVDQGAGEKELRALEVPEYALDLPQSQGTYPT